MSETNTNLREIDLDYLVDMHPGAIAADRELRILRHCRSHRLQWWWWDSMRKLLPFINWQSPA